MKNYIIEWLPLRKFYSYTICARDFKHYYVFALSWVIFSLIISGLPFFGVGKITLGIWFSLSINILLLFFYLWLLVGIKKNDLGNGVPFKW